MSWRFWKRGKAMPTPGDEGWEQALVNRVVLDQLAERRRSRRWGVFFKLLTFAYLIVLLVLLWPDDLVTHVSPGEDHTALIEVKGLVAPQTNAGADRVLTALRRAYEDENTQGIILRINSPGGSPVQAGYINDEIRRLRKQHPDIPVYAVAADLCASGGYYIAVAADAIYVDKASLIGSIGVRIDAFGFVEALQELGIERRLLTAGQNKGILDPFSPLPAEQRRYLQGVLDQLHRQFIEVVRAGRGERLKGGDELFSGLFWSGEESVALGLADGLGSASSVARELIGAEKIVEYSTEKDLLEHLADRLGAAFAASLLRLTGADGYPLAR
ncbi:MAG: S49 family peptidase [Candidatus Thiosymbion ectosymbiont of Robbea hypermnestra]|nr:S49 family peptidase [Candidatus Thiosymbion ectosymbiont of Robbea hypermnestra]